MKKISKKIVSLVTMAAFVLTLVPAAAFGATVDGDNEVTLQNETIFLKNNTAVATLNIHVGNDKLAEGNQIGLWVGTSDEDSSVLKEQATFTAIPGLTSKAGSNWAEGIFWLKGSDEANTTYTATATFTTAGEYPIWASHYSGGNDPSDLMPVYVGTVTVKEPVTSNTQSYFGTENANASVDVKIPVNVDFTLLNASNEDVTDYYDVNTAAIAIWATDGDVVTDALVVDDGTADEVFTRSYAYKLQDLEGVTVAFSRAPKNADAYVLHAALVVGNPDSIADLESYEIPAVDDKHKTVEVTAEDVVADSIKIARVSGVTVNNPDNDNVWESTFEKNNGVNTNTVKVTVTADGKAYANKEVSVDASSALDVTYMDMNGEAFEDGVVTTDRKGEFQIKYTTDKDGTFAIYIEADDAEATLKITAGKEDRQADTIVANEKDVTLDVNDSLANVVTYTIYDQDGNEVTTDATDSFMASEPAVDVNSTLNRADYVKLTQKPDKFKGEATDFSLAYDEDAEAYTLKYDEKGTAKGDLVAGDYTVRVYLESGNYADASFTLGKFNANKVVDMTITTEEDTVEYDNGTINYTVLAVDENGISKDVTETDDYILGIDKVSNLTVTETDNGKLTVTFNGSKDNVIGTEIVLTAASEKYGKLDQATVTVVDLGVGETLEFSSTEGKVNTNNTVTATVVDENGNKVDADGTVIAYVADQSNADANVDVTADPIANNGKADLTIYSDKATTVDIVVGIQKDADKDDGSVNNSPIYAATLTYTIGEADVTADTIVGMTIGSPDYIVNNDLVAGDAAPYVDSNWRTMVPFSALARTLGATVDWDGTDRTVTVVDGDTEIVMTIDSTTYTVNGEERTMDTAPVIGEGDRTYVPIRFLAQELGYQVTPLKDANGLTAGVVFQK